MYTGGGGVAVTDADADDEGVTDAAVDDEGVTDAAIDDDGVTDAAVDGDTLVAVPLGEFVGVRLAVT